MNANNNMLKLLHDQQPSEMTEMLAVQNDRIQRIENTLAICQKRILMLAEREPNDWDSENTYLSTLAYCRRENNGSHLGVARALDELAADRCRELDIRIGREPNALWGWINLYPLKILKECHVTMNWE